MLLAITGWFALVVQLYLIVHHLSQSSGFLHSVTNYFSFFTIESNLLVAICCTAILVRPGSGMGKWFSSAKVQSAIAVYIVIVGFVYTLLLRKLWNPQGWQLVADTLLHDVIPVLYVLFWIFFVPKGNLQYKNAFNWLSFPLAYVLYTMIRGAITNWYPYPFLRVTDLGYGQVVVTILILAFAIWLTGLAFVTADKVLYKAKSK